MKKFTYSVAIAATLLASSNTFAQQGFGTNTPHRSAAVEIKSSNKGLLIPRVTLDALTGEDAKLNSSVDNANSLLVYHLGSTGIPAGYYYWNGTSWIAFVTSATQTSTVVTATGDDPLTSTPTTVDGVSTYDVKLTAGTNNQFLVSRLKADSTTEFESVWVTIGGDISAEAGYNAISVDKIKGVAVAYENQGTLTTVPSTGDFLFFDGTNWTNKNFKELVQTNQIKYSVVHNTLTEDILTVTTPSQGDAGYDANNITYTVNIDPTNLVNEGIKVTNALKKHVLSEEEATAVGGGATLGDEYVVLGGNLIQNTNITLNGKEFVINSDTNNFKVSGLTTVQKTASTDPNESLSYEFVPTKKVMVIDEDSDAVQMTSTADIVATGLQVQNGLEYSTSGTGSKVYAELGGDLLHPTTITASDVNTLAIDGLVNAGSTTEAVLDNNFASVVVDKDGVLRTMEKVKKTTLASFATDYKTYFEEVTVEVGTFGELNLPAPSSANGQIVNVIITANLNDYLLISGTGGSIALNDADHGSTANGLLGYGEILGQRWTIKSDGTNWIVTARM